MVELDRVFETTYLGNTTMQWIIAGAAAFAVLSVLLLIRRLVRGHYRRLLATPEVELMELPLQVASRTTVVFMIVAALFAGLQTLQLEPKLAAIARTLFTIAAFWQVGLWSTTAVLASLERKRAQTLATDRAAVGTLGIIGFIARMIIWSLVLLLTLDNLGIEIKPLLAGLGIGGIAVALAVQNVLGDLFASLSITLDRPFLVGDALGVDGINGTVEYIGVKSTRLRSVDGEQIIMPNASLLNSRVRNFTRMNERRVLLNISVSQDTPRALLERIPQLVRSLVEAQPSTRFDRAHFARISPTSFDFEVVYYVTTSDYMRHMDALQAINLGVIAAFEREGVALAYPSQRLVMGRGLEAELAREAQDVRAS